MEIIIILDSIEIRDIMGNEILLADVGIMLDWLAWLDVIALDWDL